MYLHRPIDLVREEWKHEPPLGGLLYPGHTVPWRPGRNRVGCGWPWLTAAGRPCSPSASFEPPRAPAAPRSAPPLLLFLLLLRHNSKRVVRGTTFVGTGDRLDGRRNYLSGLLVQNRCLRPRSQRVRGEDLTKPRRLHSGGSTSYPVPKTVWVGAGSNLHNRHLHGQGIRTRAASRCKTRH